MEERTLLFAGDAGDGHHVYKDQEKKCVVKTKKLNLIIKLN